MSEWNLSVRLTGQGSDLKQTLKDSAKEARKLKNRIKEAREELALLRTAAAGDITVRLDIDAGHLRSDVTAALTAAGSGQGLAVRLDLDADHLRSEVTSALTAAGAGQGLAVNLRLGNAMQLRREVEDAVRWAAWGHRITIPIGLADPMQLRRDVSAAVRWASMNQTIRVRVDPDTSRLRTPLPRLPGGGSRGGGGGGGADLGLAELLPIATAAIPLIAGLAANLAPLAGMFAAAGGGAAAFGIALAGQVGPLKEASEAEKAYQDAVSEHGAGSREAAQAQLAYQRQLASMPPETQKASVALSRLKTQFGDWSDEMSEFTMVPVTKGMTVLGELLPHLTPEVKAFSGSMDRLVTVAGGAISTPGFDRLSDKAAELTEAKLDDFTDQVIHLMRILSDGSWDNGGVGKVLAYMRENGPAAREALNAIGDAVGNLLEAAADAGPSMLTLVTAAAQLVSAIPPEAVAVILQAAFALKVLTLAGAAAGAVAGRITAVRTAILGLAAASTAAGGGLAGLRAAFLALSTAGKASVIVAGIGLAVVAFQKLSDLGESAPPNVDKLTTSLGQLGRTGKATGYVADQFGSDFEKLGDQIEKVMNPSTIDSINNWGADITNGFLDASDSTEEFTKSADAIDESLTNLVRNGNAKQAAAALEYMTASMSPEAAARLREELDGYDSALADLKFEADLAADSMTLFERAASDVQAQLGAQKQAADGLRESLIALNETNRDAYSAEINYEQAIDDLTASFKENGNTLDIHTDKGRRNGEAMVKAAQAQDELIVAGIAAGDSFETMSGKSKDLRAEMLELATKGFGGNKKAAEDYVNTLLGTPAQVDTMIKVERAQAISGLTAVQEAIDATPDAHSITVDTLNASAVAALEAVGLKTEQLKDGKTRVFTANGQALGSIKDVQTALANLKDKGVSVTAKDKASQAARNAKAAIDKVRDKQVTITARYRTIGIQGSAARTAAKMQGRADGAVVDYYADGGMRENHIAQIAPAGQYRVWAEQETGGESYIPLALSKRGRSRRITEETVKRLGGDPASIDWYASGGISGWQYDPGTGSLYSPTDAGRAGHKTRKVKGKDVDYFDVGTVERKLWDLGKANVAWARNLEKVAERAGTDVAEALASMGEDGVAIAKKMATGTNKYVASMSMALRNLEFEASASLKAFTTDLNHAVGNQSVFQQNLAKLAAQGYGSLAARLAEQNDKTAYQLAADAASSRSKASKANTAAKKADQALTPDQLGQLVEIIAAITTKTTSLHAVAGKTGLGEDEIIAVANKARQQISESLGSKATRFLTDLGKANKGLAYADGGIRAGLYATQGGIVRFAEPSTRGEAYIPLSPAKRRTAFPVLADVASRFGVGLTDASAGRPVVIVQHGDTTQVTVTPVRTGATATDIAAQVGRSVRRARRGGVAARA